VERRRTEVRCHDCTADKERREDSFARNEATDDERTGWSTGTMMTLRSCGKSEAGTHIQVIALEMESQDLTSADDRNNRSLQRQHLQSFIDPHRFICGPSAPWCRSLWCTPAHRRLDHTARLPQLLHCGYSPLTVRDRLPHYHFW